jgi:molybdenum cofactor synthesis domain-containing protein
MGSPYIKDRVMTISFGILTISDRSAAGEREDRSGPVLEKAVIDAGWIVSEKTVVPDEIEDIIRILVDWADQGEIQVILTTGGTGFSPRDITPEATRQVIDRPAPGLAEAMRAGSLEITPHAMLSRAEVGIRKSTLIINLPGSPKGALENFRIIAPVISHAVQLLEDDNRAEGKHQHTLGI